MVAVLRLWVSAASGDLRSGAAMTLLYSAIKVERAGYVSQEVAERDIDSGRVWVRMRSGALWQARRNGATKTWKRNPGQFRIPIKFGFKYFGELTSETEVELCAEGVVL